MRDKIFSVKVENAARRARGACRSCAVGAAGMLYLI